ncbi:hypothetical protein DV736_g280, partial [Chaetothyriales sp. CBS 134916]
MSTASDDMDCIQSGPPGLPHASTFPTAQARTVADDSKSTAAARDAESGRNRLGEAASELNAKPMGREAESTVIHIPPADDWSTVHANAPNDSASAVTAVSAAAATATATASGSCSSSTSPLPSERSAAAASLQARFASYMDNVQSYVFTASQRLNDLTGYSSIQSLKDSIAVQETEVAEARAAVKANRARYAEAIRTRSEIQREVNDLLHRKQSWTPEDVENFTRLYRSDHANEQAEQSAQQAMASAEQAYEEASTRLGRSILARYHEEQIWSDKIRQMSTWGTWGLMAINILLFIILQVLLEPWRRRRLVRGFEEKVEAALQHREHEGLLMKEEADAAIRAAETAASNVSLTKSDTEEAASEHIAQPPLRASNALQSMVAAATAAYARSEAAVHSLFSGGGGRGGDRVGYPAD